MVISRADRRCIHNHPMQLQLNMAVASQERAGLRLRIAGGIELMTF